MPAPAARASVKLVLRKDKVRSDGTAPVLLRMTAHRKSRYAATGVYVPPRDWNANRQEVRASHDIAEALNSRLAKIRNEAQTIALDATSAGAVKAALAGTGGSLTGYFERFIAGLDASGQLWEYKKYKTTLVKLRAALGDHLAWGEVDREALVRFERYLRQTRKNAPNTVLKELTRLRRVIKQAVRDGEVKPADDPFLVYEKPKGQKVERRKLSFAEVGRMELLGADDGLVPGTLDEVARDAFVFAFYAGGMRFSDVCHLKADDVVGSRVDYRMLKTGTPMSVPLPEPALAIAGKYSTGAGGRGGFLFPFLRSGDDADGVRLRRRIGSRNAQVNESLKRIAVLAELEPEGLSTHVARHSFADYARTKTRDLYAISKSLGHQNLQTTQTYLKSFDRDAVDKLAEELWE